MSLRIDTKRGRDKLEPRREPYWHKYTEGRYLGLRKLSTGGASWIARYRAGDTAPGSHGETPYKALGELTESFDFDQALAEAVKWFAERDRGVKVTTDTVADACRNYVKDRRAAKGETASNDAHRRFQRTVYGGGGKKGDRYEPNAIGAVLLSKLKATHLKKWRDEFIAAKLSKASANRTRTALLAALNLAIMDKHVSADLLIELRSFKPFKDANKRRELYLDLAQRRKLLNACTGALRDLVEAAALTGARAGELVNAKRSAFDARTGMLTLSGKTGARPVPLSPTAIALLERLSKDKLPGAFLLTRDDGMQWQHSDWDELVRDAATAAELPEGVCLYTLRHSWITAALLGGMSLLEVARMVGTSVAMIDKNYGQFSNESARERLAKVAML